MPSPRKRRSHITSSHIALFDDLTFFHLVLFKSFPHLLQLTLSLLHFRLQPLLYQPDLLIITHLRPFPSLVTVFFRLLITISFIVLV